MMTALFGESWVVTEALLVFLALATLTGLLVGYRWGRRVGLEEGEIRGWTRAPVELHRRALASGLCPTCGTRAPGIAAKSFDGEGEEERPSRSSS